jgi:hypothetical protein
MIMMALLRRSKMEVLYVWNFVHCVFVTFNMVFPI